MIIQWKRQRDQGIRFDRQNAWRTMDGGSWHCTGGRDQDHPQEKEIQKGKVVVWGGLKNSWVKKKSKRQRRKAKIYPFECRVPKKNKVNKKVFLSSQCKEIDKNNRMESSKISSRKLEISMEHFMQRWTNKG